MEIKRYIKQLTKDELQQLTKYLMSNYELNIGKKEDNKILMITPDNMNNKYFAHISIQPKKTTDDKEILKAFRQALCDLFYFLYGSKYHKRLKNKPLPLFQLTTEPNPENIRGRHAHIVLMTQLPLLNLCLIYGFILEKLKRQYPNLTATCCCFNDDKQLLKCIQYDEKNEYYHRSYTNLDFIKKKD